MLRKPVSRQLIAKFASVKDEIIVQEVLNEWSQFLHYSQIQGQTRYKVYHASFADFLSRKEIIEAAGIEITEIHGSITNALLEDLDTTEDED
ncbi:hypothetical protein WN50_35445 [Limnoraphis robusta CS-951]|uniref:Uncharacterized protein n=1 Tax=Limnoraphis robusta CS-951 TaxID=1637645 RepID=A0A0J9EWS3_9CYAN|nr:hypothetical protein WN50_35445 [Limnoraphis robusta CS-951]